MVRYRPRRLEIEMSTMETRPGHRPRRARPSQGNLNEDPGRSTLEWLCFATALAERIDVPSLTAPILAVSLLENCPVEILGLKGWSREGQPKWFGDLTDRAAHVDPSEVEEFLPFSPSLSDSVVETISNFKPLKDCFQAFMASGDPHFKRVFGGYMPGRSAEGNGREIQRLKQASLLANAVRGTLQRQLVGQSEAVSALGQLAFEMSLGQVKSGPRGIALFLGPPGVGKSMAGRLFAEAISSAGETLDGKPAIATYDMTQFTTWGDASNLFGNGLSGGSIGAFVQKNPECVVIINEFEKAHPKVLESFLPPLDEGCISAGSSGAVDFSRVVFVFTSNLGSEYWKRPGAMPNQMFAIDPVSLLEQAANPKEDDEWHKTKVPLELVSRLAKGKIVFFRPHKGLHLLSKLEMGFRQLAQSEEVLP